MTLAAWIALLAAVAVAVWLADVALRPYARCLFCAGTGRSRGSTAKRYGLCKRCGGSGRRLRLAARWVRPDLREK